MCRGGGYPIDRRKLFGDEIRDIAHCPAFHHKREVKAARHEVDGLYFGIIAYTLCNGVEASVTLRSYFQLYESRHGVTLSQFRVDYCFISGNHAFIFKFFDHCRNCFFVTAESSGNLCRREAGIVFKHGYDFILHFSSSFSSA